MEIAAFASFAALVLAWIVLPVRSEAPAAAETAPEALPEPVAA